MSFMSDAGRSLKSMARVRPAWAAAVGLLLSFFPWAILPAVRAEERTVLAVVTCDSYGDLKKQLGWLGGQIGQPGLAGMAESVLLMATQGRGLAGLDVKRPLGAVVTTDGGDLAVHGFVPVKSLDKLLESLQGVTGPVERSGDSRSLTLPSGIPLSMVEKDGWAIVSPQGMDVEAVDPAPLFEPLAKNYTLGVELFPSVIPEPLRLQLRMLIEQGAAAAGEQGQQLDARALAAALDGLADTESLALGIAIDADKDRMFVENRVVVVPGSAAARAMEGTDKGRLSVPLPAAADGGRPAITGHFMQQVPEAARQEVLAMLDVALPPGSDDRLTKTMAMLLREVVRSVLATGGIDAAACIDVVSADKQDGPAIPAITAGMRVKDGAALEASVKKALAANDGRRALPPGVEVTFDAGKVGGTNLHTITVDLSGTEAAESLGQSLDLTLAVAADHAYLLAGPDAERRLASALDPNAKPDPQAVPILGLDLAVGRVLEYAADRGGLTAEATAPADNAGDGEAGMVRFLIRPIERGVATRLSADGAALRAAAAGAASADGADGPAIPGGFPLPLPAR